uniref:Tc1-like transposase DDE domain-containing protein n=1 Tax=Hucho hucho TaxID=62062 RepID=A0A4W5L6H5_9TELE
MQYLQQEERQEPFACSRTSYTIHSPVTMTQNTPPGCVKAIPRRRVMVLHQMTWPPQSPDLNPIEMVWDELDRRVKEKQPTSAQHMWELLQDCWKSISHEAG